MGRPQLPSISKIEDVLDLLTDPDKYKRYMLEFKSMYDEVQNALDNYSTKQLADKYMSEAAETLELVKADKKKAADEVAAAEDVHKKADQRYNDAERLCWELDEKQTQIAKDKAELEEAKKGLAYDRSEFNDDIAKADAHYAQVVKDIETKTAELEARRAKFAAAFNEV